MDNEIEGRHFDEFCDTVRALVDLIRKGKISSGNVHENPEILNPPSTPAEGPKEKGKI